MLARANGLVYNGGMIRHAILTIALAAGCLSAAPSASSSVAKTAREAETAMLQELQKLVKTGSEDFCLPARAYLDKHGSCAGYFEAMQKAAKNGNAAAQTWSAMYQLLYVQSGTPEYANVLKLVAAAAEKKYAPALILSAGLHAQSNPSLSQTHLRAACALGNPKARTLYLMQTGRLSAGNVTLPEVASELKKNNYHLEEALASIQTVEAKAIEWMHKAEAHGSASAPFLLSQTLVKGEDEQHRLAHMKLAAERGNLVAMHYYGALLCRANTHPLAIQLGIKHDFALGSRYMQLAAMQGMPEASAELALMYAQGQLDSVPVELVYRLFEHAHRCGIAEGTAGVGYCKVLGAGCPVDAEGGISLLLQARDKGALWVNHALASVYFNGTAGVQKNLRKAIDFLTEDAAVSSASAYAIMAAITALGNETTPPDLSTAEYYLDMAKAATPNAQQIYDAIVLTKSWICMPELVKAVQK